MPPSSSPADHSKPLTLIVNAGSRSGRENFDAAQAALVQAGLTVKAAHLAGSFGEIDQLLAAEIKEGAPVVVIGGGDGTLSYCARHLAHSPVAMGVLPLGTGNTLARSLDVPLELEGAAQTIADGKVVAIDVGEVNGQIFVNSVTLGVSAAIAEGLTSGLKKRYGLLAWPLASLQVLYQHRPIVLKVITPQRSFVARTHQLVVANGRYIAGAVIASPDASVQDGSLRVFTLGDEGKGSLATTALKWLTGWHRQDPEVNYCRASQVRVESWRAIAADVDGEIGQQTPLDIKVLPGALRVVVPRDFIASEA